jgi:hypothetical protein
MDTIMTKSLALLAALAALSAPAFAENYSSKNRSNSSYETTGYGGSCAEAFVRKHGYATSLNIINSEDACEREFRRIEERSGNDGNGNGFN